jgi:hypothetical protein
MDTNPLDPEPSTAGIKDPNPQYEGGGEEENSDGDDLTPNAAHIEQAVMTEEVVWIVGD